MDGKMLAGKVKFFDHRKGYGFLIAKDGTEVHVGRHAIEPDAFGRKHLRRREVVYYQVVNTEKGPDATVVKRTYMEDVTEGTQTPAEEYEGVSKASVAAAIKRGVNFALGQV